MANVFPKHRFRYVYNTHAHTHLKAFSHQVTCDYRMELVKSVVTSTSSRTAVEYIASLTRNHSTEMIKSVCRACECTVCILYACVLCVYRMPLLIKWLCFGILFEQIFPVINYIIHWNNRICVSLSACVCVCVCVCKRIYFVHPNDLVDVFVLCCANG